MNIACTVRSHNTESKCFCKINCLISIFALLLMLVKIDHCFIDIYQLYMIPPSKDQKPKLYYRILFQVYFICTELRKYTSNIYHKKLLYL